MRLAAEEEYNAMVAPLLRAHAVHARILLFGGHAAGTEADIRASERAPHPAALGIESPQLDLQGLVPKFISNILLQELPMKLSGIYTYFGSNGQSHTASNSTVAVDPSTGDVQTSRINFMEGHEMDSGLVTPGRTAQFYVPKSGADKALPKLSFDNLGPSTGGPKKKKKG